MDKRRRSPRKSRPNKRSLESPTTHPRPKRRRMTSPKRSSIKYGRSKIEKLVRFGDAPIATCLRTGKPVKPKLKSPFHSFRLSPEEKRELAYDSDSSIEEEPKPEPQDPRPRSFQLQDIETERNIKIADAQATYENHRAVERGILDLHLFVTRGRHRERMERIMHSLGEEGRVGSYAGDEKSYANRGRGTMSTLYEEYIDPHTALSFTVNVPEKSVIQIKYAEKYE